MVAQFGPGTVVKPVVLNGALFELTAAPAGAVADDAMPASEPIELTMPPQPVILSPACPATSNAVGNNLEFPAAKSLLMPMSCAALAFLMFCCVFQSP